MREQLKKKVYNAINTNFTELSEDLVINLLKEQDAYIDELTNLLIENVRAFETINNAASAIKKIQGK